MQSCVFICVLFAATVAGKFDEKESGFTYQYEAKDEMDASASTIPYQGYQVYEGGLGGIGGGFGGGLGGGIAGGYPGYIGGAGIGGAGLGGYGVGGIGAGGLGAGGIGAGGLGAGGLGAGGIGAGGLGVGGIGLGAGNLGGVGAGRFIGSGIGLGGTAGIGGVGLGGAGLGLAGAGLGAGSVGGAGLGLAGAGLGAGGAGLGVGSVGGAGLGLAGAGAIGGAGLGGLGGGYVNKNLYSGENKNVNGHTIENVHGNKGEAGQSGAEGFSHGEVAVKDVKGDTGYYNDQHGGKKVLDDGKTFSGGQHFNEAAGKGEGENSKVNHKKGHVTKGYKSSHHKDESGETATYFDEANDEGGKFFSGGNQGSFGKEGQSSFKGRNENGEFAANDGRKQGHYNNEHVVDNANTGKGQYGQKGFHSGGEIYSLNNGAGEQAQLGRQEANGLFLKHHPHIYAPYYG